MFKVRIRSGQNHQIIIICSKNDTVAGQNIASFSHSRDDGFQFFYGFYWFSLKNMFWGSKKTQNLGFLKCAGTTDSSFFMDFIVFY